MLTLELGGSMGVACAILLFFCLAVHLIETVLLLGVGTGRWVGCFLARLTLD